MSTTNQLGPRPAPHLISFDRDCFTTSVVTEWVIILSAPSYPERFTTREAAEARGRKLGRTPHATERTIYTRVRWF